jgi:hypothetical protein
MFAQFFAAFFSYPFKTVYGKALPRMAVYCHFETAPSFYSSSFQQTPPQKMSEEASAAPTVFEQ